jgi:hypothetical protein
VDVAMGHDFQRYMRYLFLCILPLHSSPHEKPLQSAAQRHPSKGSVRAPRVLCSGQNATACFEKAKTYYFARRLHDLCIDCLTVRFA